MPSVKDFVIGAYETHPGMSEATLLRKVTVRGSKNEAIRAAASLAEEYDFVTLFQTGRRIRPIVYWHAGYRAKGKSPFDPAFHIRKMGLRPGRGTSAPRHRA